VGRRKEFQLVGYLATTRETPSAAFRIRGPTSRPLASKVSAFQDLISSCGLHTTPHCHIMLHGVRLIMSKRSVHVSLRNPSTLKSFDQDTGTIRVVIETPKGSRNKYAFDVDERVFSLKKVLPAGMAFPYDFGFVPSTRADDGDPVDVLVLMDEPAFAGCVLECRPIGVIEGEQKDGKKKIRNDRIVAVEQDNHSYAAVKHIDDLGKPFVRELEQFFVNYHELTGKPYKVLDVRGPGEARRRIEDGRKAYRKT
jgi:inorganic pyrophosphatase